MTTAPVLGQPAAAYPAAPRHGRAGLLAVPALVVAVSAVLGVVLSPGVTPRLLFALAGLAVPVGIQAALYARQRRLAGDLQRSQSSFRTLVKSSVDPVVILDDQLRVTYASEAIAELIGYDAADLIGESITAPVHPDDRATLFAGLNSRRPDADEVAVRTARVRHADGRWRLIQATVRDLRTDPDVGALVLYCRDVTARVPAPGLDPELAELSLTDPVTGLPNRAALVRRLGAVQREGGRPFALAAHRRRRAGHRGAHPRRRGRGPPLAHLPAHPRAARRGLAGPRQGRRLRRPRRRQHRRRRDRGRPPGRRRRTAADPRRHAAPDRRRRRHRAAARRRHRRGAAPRRPGPAQRPHRRRPRRPPLRRRPAHGAGPARRSAHRPRRGAGPRRAAPGLPARGRRRHAPHRLGRGAAALAAPAVRRRLPHRVRAAGRGIAADHRARPLGAARGLRHHRRPARHRPRRGGQRLRPPGAQRRAGTRRHQRPGDQRPARRGG